MARKALVSCNTCGALEDVDAGQLSLRTPEGWFVVKTTWPQRHEHDAFGRGEEWLVCSPDCLVGLADITGQRANEAAS